MFKKSMSAFFIAAIVLLSCSGANAGTWGKRVKITGYYAYSTGVAFFTTDGNENPENCPGSIGYLALDSAASNFKVLYATVMAAQANGQTVSLNYEGCLSGYPKINSVAVPGVW